MSESQAILVDCISLHHHYRGWLRTNGGRLSDELSNVQSDSVVLRDVQITAAGRNTPSLECSELTLLKERILIAMPRDSHERPAAQRLTRFQKKDRHGIVVVLPGHLLSGVIQLPKRSVSWSILRESGALQRFIGITDVTVHSAVFRLMPQTCPVAIVQRDAVEAIELTSAPLQEFWPIEALAE
jgi:hypothetical protein